MGGCARAHSSAFFFVPLFILFGFSAAKDLMVGGKEDAWKVPSPPGSDPLNKWAERSRFQVGDNLVWKYDGAQDSVLIVSKEDYDNCSTSNPIKHYNDGNTKVELDRPGLFYFISGSKGHCEKGEKLIVLVMHPREPKGLFPAPLPAQALLEGPSPALAPAPSGATSAALKGGVVMMALLVLAMWGF